MSSTRQVITAIVTGLRELPVREAHFFGGKLDEKVLEDYGVNAPCVLLTHVGTVPDTVTPGKAFTVTRFVAFIVAKGSANKRDVDLGRHGVALDLSDALFDRLVRGETWGLSDVSAPRDIQTTNLFSTKFDQKGLAIYSIVWDQRFSLTNAVDDDLVPFRLFVADHFLVRETTGEQPLPADTSDATDRVELEGLE